VSSRSGLACILVCRGFVLTSWTHAVPLIVDGHQDKGEARAVVADIA
jgi:hypothetical protein